MLPTLFSVVFENIMNISSLSTYEYVNIVGQYNYQQFGASIDPAIYERGYSEKQLEVLKKQAVPREVKSCNLSIVSPLEEFEFKGFDYTYGLYNQYKTGTLPFKGPVSEQPARIIEIFNLLTQLDHETQKRMNREQKANG